MAEQSKYEIGSRFSAGVIDTAQMLKSAHHGVQIDVIRKAREWLIWRISSGWHQSECGSQLYDDAVRSLASAALLEGVQSWNCAPDNPTGTQ